MRRFMIVFLMTLSVFAQKEKDIAFDEVRHTLSNGNELIFHRIKAEQLGQLPMPVSINYFLAEGMTLRVMGPYVYIDEAAFYENNTVLVLNPWQKDRGYTLSGDILAMEPFDFLDFSSDCSCPMGLPAKTPFEYFLLSSPDFASDKEQPLGSNIPSETIDPWQCDANVHDPSKPHPIHGNNGDPCHANVGASGMCQKGGVNGIATLACSSRVTSAGNLVEVCTAELTCNNGWLGVLDGGPARVEKIRVTSRTSSVTDFMIQTHPDGTLEMRHDGQATTLDCRK